MIPSQTSKICAVCKSINRPAASYCLNCGCVLRREDGFAFQDGDASEVEPEQEKEPEPEEKKEIILKGRFKILEKIFQDNHGNIYSAHDLKRERDIIVKEDFEYSIGPDDAQPARDRFLLEGKILSTTHHKYIPRVIDAFILDAKYYVLMKKVDGRSLAELINDSPSRKTGIPLINALKIIISLCDLVTYLHEFKPPVIHRNIKPGKIMINTSKKVVLLPWVSRPAKNSPLIGSKGFASPEQFRGEYSAASDVYGLGATLHYMLTGKDPSKEAPFHFLPLSILRPDLSGELEMVISKSLQLQPEDRYRSTGDLKKALLQTSKKLIR